ncbi:MAG: HlyD family efflux transporter periplasmic adaptor subunit, partial [Pseudomonadales bacterium]|nr:HlyD family efflux transporter periplasmic adaptor subunit [Pseudomonadales bacterium]
VTRVLEELLESGGNGSAATVLIAEGDDVQGAITLEHREANFFTRDKIGLCKQIALLVGPILELKRRDERPLIQKVRDSLAELGRTLIGEEYLLAKTIVGTLAGVILYLGIASGDHRVSADATLEGSIQRHISAPMDGYVTESFARAGDVVHEGDPLFALDDKDLMLERLKWSSQRLQVEQQYRDALANHDKAEASIQKAQLDQASAQIALIDSQLSRTRAVAPFDGVIVAGDLSQKLGAPVQKGDTLLKVAPLDSYRIILEVDEMDIGWLSEDQQGELSLSSLPGESFAFLVEKVTPESTARDGRNTFRVEARLLEQTDRLRPGMQGSGKVLIGERSQLWI